VNGDHEFIRGGAATPRRVPESMVSRRSNKLSNSRSSSHQIIFKDLNKSFYYMFLLLFFDHLIFLRTPRPRTESTFSGKNFQPGSNYWLFAQWAGM
jgi:hypothetical protein